MCHDSELTLRGMFMMPCRSCEVSAALLIRPSWAREREGAYPCAGEVYRVQQGADGSHSEPKAKPLSGLDFQWEGEMQM